MSLIRLHQRDCVLDEKTHRYYWNPDGKCIEMAVSVTGVISAGKPPVDYSRYPEAAPRGTHVHRCLQAIATGAPMPDPISPEGIDCSAWFKQLQGMDFWNQIDVVACEYTMCDTRKSLGGQLDLLCVYKGQYILADLKTKSASWKGPSKEDIAGYKQQAGGYLHLLASGNEAFGGCWVDSCRTLVVTPTQVKWLSKMDPDDCSLSWEESWDRYSAQKTVDPF